MDKKVFFSDYIFRGFSSTISIRVLTDFQWDKYDNTFKVEMDHDCDYCRLIWPAPIDMQVATVTKKE